MAPNAGSANQIGTPDSLSEPRIPFLRVPLWQDSVEYSSQAHAALFDLRRNQRVGLALVFRVNHHRRTFRQRTIDKLLRRFVRLIRPIFDASLSPFLPVFSRFQQEWFVKVVLGSPVSQHRPVPEAVQIRIAYQK